MIPPFRMGRFVRESNFSKVICHMGVCVCFLEEGGVRETKRTATILGAEFAGEGNRPGPVFQRSAEVQGGAGAQRPRTLLLRSVGLRGGDDLLLLRRPVAPKCAPSRDRLSDKSKPSWSRRMGSLSLSIAQKRRTVGGGGAGSEKSCTAPEWFSLRTKRVHSFEHSRGPFWF